MKKSLKWAVCVPLGFCSLSMYGQGNGRPLTNETIVRLVASGVPTETVINAIRGASAVSFTFLPGDLELLQRYEVSDDIVKAMAAKAKGNRISPPSLSSGSKFATPQSQRDTPRPPSISPLAFVKADVPGAGLVTDIGVYVKRGDSWDEVVAEPINWKSGGVVKNLATVGMVKRDRNGNLAGPRSRNVITLPAEFLIYTREGESYGEYQLLSLHENNDNREFRVFTGGIVHQKGGAQRDLITYDATKVASRTYHFVLTDLVAGEYGFLPPNLLTTTSASAQLGKMYTFRIRE